MHLEKWFHFWFYATLAVGSICLALPTTFFVPWMPVLLTVTLVLLFLAWRNEGWWILSDAAANYVGVFIALGAAGWILFQVPRSEDELIAGGVPWPAGLLPHLSPLLMMLLIVKVYRPKRLPDFWVIQTIGLMTVTLAAVLADAPIFGVFLIAYLVCLVWCLALYHPVREQRLLNATAEAAHIPLFASAVPAHDRAAPSTSARTPPAPWPASWRLGGAARVTRWTIIVLVVGQVIFLAAPRQAPSYWVAKQLSMGGAGAGLRAGVEAGIDMNRTGRVELSEAPAFEVEAEDAKGAPAALPGDQHWQVDIYEYYASGRWYPVIRAQAKRFVNVAPMQTLPNVRRAEAALPGDVAFHFKVKPVQVGGLVLAEPAVPGRIGLAPTIEDRPHDLGFFALVDGCDTVAAQLGQVKRRVYGYEQHVTLPRTDVFPATVTNRAYHMLISTQGVPLGSRQGPSPLQRFARDLLERVSGLSAVERQLDQDKRVPPARHAKVARAICNHLAHSGEYRYTLELRRHDDRIDPAVDFLLNVKEGHCERYAGALALLLRSLGIPCRVVNGYLGASAEEPGRYVIRQNQAHSWVQALVPAAAAPPEIPPQAAELPPESDWQWLVLDPTPSTEAVADPWTGWMQWLSDNFDSRQFWRQMILEYNPDQQANTASVLWQQIGSWRGLGAGIGLVTVVGLVWGGRRGWRWLWTAWGGAAPVALVPEAALYRRLVKLLAPLGVVPAPGATPREFADSATLALRMRAVAEPLAATPLDVVAAYYATRFGARPFDLAGLEKRVDALAARLAN
jgi:protein-glutamine gamma-glutamyltransferase